MAFGNCVIRHAWPSDIPAIRSMQERSLWIIGRGFYTPVEIAALVGEIGTMDDGVVLEGHYFVAENACGAILGAGGWSQRSPGYAAALGTDGAEPVRAMIRSVFVDPAAGRRGIATAIMQRTEDDATESGVETLCVMATLSAVQFYTKLGYAARKPRYFQLAAGVTFGCVEMEKTLAFEVKVA